MVISLQLHYFLEDGVRNGTRTRPICLEGRCATTNTIPTYKEPLISSGLTAKTPKRLTLLNFYRYELVRVDRAYSNPWIGPISKWVLVLPLRTQRIRRCSFILGMFQPREILVPLTGLEPVRPKTSDFKSDVSANSTTAANKRAQLRALCNRDCDLQILLHKVKAFNKFPNVIIKPVHTNQKIRDLGFGIYILRDNAL